MWTKEKNLACIKDWKKRNPDKVKVYGLRYYTKNKKAWVVRSTRYLKEHPWVRVLQSAKSRCTRVNQPGYKYYGALGITCNLTVQEVKELWFRDNAQAMLRPSIDRIDPEQDYTMKNCRFIELLENIARAKYSRNITEKLASVTVLLHDIYAYRPYVDYTANQLRRNRIGSRLVGKIGLTIFN